MSDTTTIPGYRAGTWVIDPTHSEVGFSVRHLMISKVKGKFERFTATFTTGENPLDSKVEATAEVASINTNEPNRDGHLRTGDFFEAEKYPSIHFVSTAVRANGDDFLVDGELTIKDVTKPVELVVEFEGVGRSPYGFDLFGFSAHTEIDREDWGLTYNMALESGGVMIGKKVKIEIEGEAIRQA